MRPQATIECTTGDMPMAAGAWVKIDSPDLLEGATTWVQWVGPLDGYVDITEELLEIRDDLLSVLPWKLVEVSSPIIGVRRFVRA